MRSEKGFTLVEVILAIGVFAIVAVPIVSMFLDGVRITSKSENTSEAYAYAQQLIERMKGGETIEGEVSDLGSKKFIAGTIEGTEYTYTVTMKNFKKEEVLKAEEEADGEDFYKYMNTTDSEKLVLNDSGINYNKTGDWIDYSNIKSVKVKNNKYGMWFFEKKVEGPFISGPTGNSPFDESVTVIRSWLDYSALSQPIELKVENVSGKSLDIYLQSTEENKNNLKIKNLAGKINVYGPVTQIPENRGRKQTAEVTVTVENIRTGEHAELTANVTYYE